MLSLYLSALTVVAPLQEALATSAHAREIPPGRLIVVGQFDASITVADPKTGEVLAQLDTGLRPDEVVASPDGRHAYVMVYGGQNAGQRIAAVELEGEPRLGAIHELPGLARPHGCEWVGDHLWFTAEANACVARFDPQAGTVDAVFGHGGAAGHMLAYDENSDRIFVANVLSQDCSVIDLRSPADRVKRIDLPAAQPEGLACAPDGKEVWFAHRQGGVLSILDTQKLEVSGTVEIGGLPFRLAFTPQGALYASDAVGGTLVELDSAKREVVRRIELGGAGTGFVLHPSGDWAAISMANADEAAIVDLVHGEVVKRIPVGDHPDGIAWALPAGTIPEAGPVATRRAGFLGVFPRFVSRKRRVALGGDFEGGVLVQGLHDQGGARAAGIGVGDVLLTLDGETLEGPKHFMELLAGRRKGDEVFFQLIRSEGGERVEVSVRLLEPPLW